MERKTKYRILGIIVLIAVVIILLPFVSKRHDFMPDTAAIKAPPFPNQPINVSASGIEDEAIPMQQEAQQETAKANDSVQLQSDDVISRTHPSVINEVKVPDLSAPKTNKENFKDPDKTRTAKFVQNEVSIKRESLAENNLIKNTNQGLSHSSHTLADLKNILWVVQLGSFKNKGNALRLVNQLRASGYHAFIQKKATASGEQIRVFVGPANKKTDANELAMRLQNDLHIHGIILSYQPLTL